jgi:GntR family transcriptional repressor for pyruvate dehydrogenase complex
MERAPQQRLNGRSVRQDGPEAGVLHPLSHRIEVYLRERILSGEWIAGHKLPSEAGLREQFGASRTAVREAIRRLQGRGLLTTVNGSGSYVAGGQLEMVSQALNAYSVLTTDDQAFSDLLELRMAIEGDAAAKLAARQSTDDWQCIDARMAAMSAAIDRDEFAVLDIDFHMELLRLSRNSLFASLGKALRDHYSRFVATSYSRGERLRERTMTEHHRITHAICEGDPEAAREAARQHIWQARNRWKALALENGDGPKLDS